MLSLCFSLSLIKSCTVEKSRSNHFQSLYCLLLCFFSGHLYSWILLGLTITVVNEILICIVVIQWKLLSVTLDPYYLRGKGICRSLNCQCKSALQVEIKMSTYIYPNPIPVHVNLYPLLSTSGLVNIAHCNFWTYNYKHYPLSTLGHV